MIQPIPSGDLRAESRGLRVFTVARYNPFIYWLIVEKASTDREAEGFCTLDGTFPMKTRSILAVSILASLALGLAGCDEEAKPIPISDKPAIKPGPAYEPGPIHPSPVPQLPPTGPSSKAVSSDDKADMPKTEEKKEPK